MPKKGTKSFSEYDLLKNNTGFMELEEGETGDQHAIQEHVDITSANKHFDLILDKFGPYKIDYSLNGRHLLVGGAKGHIAAFDWQTKKLLCEINVMEAINDTKWLHRETMFAVAQKQWTYIYDNNGIELHCLKMLDQVLRMTFLPYHFLLATASAKSYLSWLDVSMGKMVGGVATGLGRLEVMTHNPQNAIVVLGHNSGTVTMWSPNVKEPLVKMMTHVGSVCALAVDKTGNYMATAGTENKLKIWDLRTYKLLSSSYFSSPAHHLSFSQSGLLASAAADRVSIYQDATTGSRINLKRPYLSHPIKTPGMGAISFCPYEDILGVGHSQGFTSLLVPGSGEGDYDAMEHNPMETKSQQKEAEVKRLLNKIQPELISIETKALSLVNLRSLQERMDVHIKNKFPKAPKRDRTGKGTGGTKGRRGGEGGKNEVAMRKFRKKMVRKNEEEGATDGVDATFNPLDRFKKKTKY